VLQRTARHAWPLPCILPVFSSPGFPGQNTHSLSPGFGKDSQGTVEGVTLQRHWEVLSLVKNSRILLLIFRRLHFACQ